MQTATVSSTEDGIFYLQTQDSKMKFESMERLLSFIREHNIEARWASNNHFNN